MCRPEKTTVLMKPVSDDRAALLEKAFAPNRAKEKETLAALQAAAERSDAHAVPDAPAKTADAVPGLSVAGYKAQPKWHVDLVNENKVLEEHVLRQIDHHKRFPNSFDQRLVALAKTHIDIAFMLLNRAVFQPGRIEGELPPL
jgi:hypothetical protein